MIDNITREFYKMLNKDLSKTKYYKFVDKEKKFYHCKELNKNYSTKKAICEDLNTSIYKLDKSLKSNLKLNDMYTVDIKSRNIRVLSQIDVLKNFYKSSMTEENIYYVVNDFKVFDNNYEMRKKDCLQKCKAFYCDIDFKNEKNQHLNNEELKQKKDDVYNKLINLELKPSAIVESRNGFHVYYILNEKSHINTVYSSYQAKNVLFSIDIEKWQSLEKQILNYMYVNVSDCVDFAVSDVNRVLRVPQSIHHKSDSDKFIVKVRCLSKTYSFDEIEKAFCNDYDVTKRKKVSHIYSDTKKTKNLLDLSLAIKDLDCEYFDYVDKLNVEMSMNEFVEFVKQYDIRKVFDIDTELEKAFNSVFREDKNASCTIYMYENKYYYKDFSEECKNEHDSYHTTIDLIMNYADVDFKKAVYFLAQIFNVTIISNSIEEIKLDDEFSMNQIAKLEKVAEKNKKIKFLKKSIDMYKIILKMRKRNLMQNNTDRFECAKKYLADVMQKEVKHIERYMYVLEALQLIKRVYNNNSKVKKFNNKINTYVVNEIDELKLEEHAIELKSVCSNVRNINYSHVEKVLFKFNYYDNDFATMKIS